MADESFRDEVLRLLRNSDPLTSPPASGPIVSPTDRYAHLPETTRIWLESLRDEDTKEIDDVRTWYRNTRIITSFGKWIVVALVASLVASGQIGKLFVEALSYLR